MHILWFTWKDLNHPQAGGAERVNEEIARHLAQDGHKVILLVGGFRGGIAEEEREGYRIIRLGNRYTVYWHAYRYYKRHLQGWADLVIDEMNTVPFFCKYYVKERNIVFAHQLCRKIWFYQMPFPASLIGYLVELIYLYLLADRIVIVVSESTKQDLMRSGFTDGRIHIISESIALKPVSSLGSATKFNYPTLLSLGAIRPMKRTADQISAFEIAKEKIPHLRLIVAGTAIGRYGKKVLHMIENSSYAADIEYVGPVDEREKVRLMAMSHLLMVTSVKEGWGLIVTEANSQGTPAVVYGVDGLRDSVQDGKTGVVTKENTPVALAREIIAILNDDARYKALRHSAWDDSKEYNSENCYQDFLEVVVSIDCSNANESV